ncbi:unnamed protein product [Ectocarpus sp. CCAP 1310/34]|nr:unnamed protein product [Ectocarpus sp. CCAP 1310/34]
MTTADRPHSTRNASDHTADMSLKRTVRDDEHSVVAVEVEGGDACTRSSPAEEQRQEGQKEQQQQQQQGKGGETAGGEEGDAPDETDICCGRRMLRGDAQFIFLGPVARSWRAYFDGKEYTVDSQVVTSPRTTEALDSGWEAGNSGWKCAAALGGMEVLDVLVERSNPWDGEREEFGDRGECDRGACGEWGDGIFAAGAASGNDEVLKLLMVEGCYKDEMGVKKPGMVVHNV